MADFNNLALTTSGIKALLEAQAGTTLTLSKIGMGSGSTNNFTSLGNLVTPEVMLPISEKRIDEESGFMSIVAKMTNKDITEGFYWRETGLFFEDAEGNDVLFAYACVVDDQYDYVPAYSDKRYVKHVRIANIITDSANIEIPEREGLLYVDTLTFEEYKEFVNSELTNLKEVKERPVNNNILINSNFANPVNQRGYDGTITDKSMYTIDRWKLNAGQSFNIDSNGITFKSGTATTYFVQKIKAKALFEKTVSLSMKIDGEIYSINNVLVTKDERVVDLSISNGSILMFIGYDSTDCYSIGVILYNGATPTIEWAKLEYGEVATPYVPRLYDEELHLCKRFFQKLHKIGIIQVKLEGNRLRIMVNYDNELTGSSGNIPTPIIKSVRALSDDGLSTIVASEISEYGRERAYCIFVATFDKNVYEGNLGGVQVLMEIDNEL